MGRARSGVATGMAERQRIKSIADRLAEEYVTESGESAPRDHVEKVVEAVAEPLAEAPVQDFVPLLVENAARNQMHAEGLHVEPAEEDTAPAVGDDADDADRLVSGFARPDLEARR
jgi:hypothetical protein